MGGGQEWPEVFCLGCWPLLPRVQALNFWVPMLKSPPASCVILHKLLSLWVCFLLYRMGMVVIFASRGYCENEMTMLVSCLAQVSTEFVLVITVLVIVTVVVWTLTTLEKEQGWMRGWIKSGPF